MFHHKLELLCDRVLIHRHRDPAQALGGTHAAVQTRAIVANNGKLIPAFETYGSQAARELAHLLRELAPAPRLPDAVVLLADGGFCAQALRAIQEQLRKRVQSARRRGSRAVRMAF